MLETGHAVIIADAADGDDEFVVWDVDILAGRFFTLLSGQALIVPVDDLHLEQPLPIAAHHIDRLALDVMPVDARQDAAQWLDERAWLDRADGSRWQQRSAASKVSSVSRPSALLHAQEVEILRCDDGDVVLLRI